MLMSERVKSVKGYVLLLVFVGFFSVPLTAADWYVNHETGNNSWPGTYEQPFKTIAYGIAHATAGDTVHLFPTETAYGETVAFYNRSGAAGSPITVDGHGATMTGSLPIIPSQWQEVSPGLYRCDNLYQQTDHGKYVDDENINAVIGRYFFLFDGVMNHMGRTSKGPQEPLKDPNDLEEAEWTFVRDEVAFYIKINPDKTLADYNIEAPLRCNGVAIYGNLNEHIVIRNMEFTHVYNDGFNLHADAHDIFLENVRVIECGDDGISAHETFEVRVDGFTSIGNSTGIADGQDSISDYNNIWLCGNLGIDVYIYAGTANHTIRNSIIVTDADRAIIVDSDTGPTDEGSLELENVAVIQGKGGSKVIEVNSKSRLVAGNCTFNGLSILAKGNYMEMQNCIIAGDPQQAINIESPSQWVASTNVYGLDHLQIGSEQYDADNFQTYMQNYEPGGDSIWCEQLYFDNGLKAHPGGAVTIPDVGADISSIPFYGSVCFCPNVKVDFKYLSRFAGEWLGYGLWP